MADPAAGGLPTPNTSLLSKEKAGKQKERDRYSLKDIFSTIEYPIFIYSGYYFAHRKRDGWSLQTQDKVHYPSLAGLASEKQPSPEAGPSRQDRRFQGERASQSLRFSRTDGSSTGYRSRQEERSASRQVSPRGNASMGEPTPPDDRSSPSDNLASSDFYSPSKHSSPTGSSSSEYSSHSGTSSCQHSFQRHRSTQSKPPPKSNLPSRIQSSAHRQRFSLDSHPRLIDPVLQRGNRPFHRQKRGISPLQEVEEDQGQGPRPPPAGDGGVRRGSLAEGIGPINHNGRRYNVWAIFRINRRTGLFIAIICIILGLLFLLKPLHSRTPPAKPSKVHTNPFPSLFVLPENFTAHDPMASSRLSSDIATNITRHAANIGIALPLLRVEVRISAPMFR